jgi:aminoglycoside phosphotransferase (APT) family kinase protein
VNNIFAHLSRSDELSGPPVDGETQAASARRRVLSRLGEYTALIVGPLNLRPTGAALLAEDDERIEVRISTPGSHIVLVIAPDGDLAAEVFFLRALADQRLPLPRLIAHDMACTVLPFTYALEGYIGGVSLSGLEESGPLVRVAARQLGRTLRRIHQGAAPGFGRPTVTGRWPTQSWGETLAGWLARRELPARAAAALGEEGLAALRAATLEHPALRRDRPCVVHGAVEPDRALVTVGDSVQLEALTRPGEIVGGDPLFDLAHGLLLRHPPSFRQGLMEGYCAAGALAPEQQDRLRRLALLLHVADTLWRDESAAVARLPGEVMNTLRAIAPDKMTR